MSKKTIKIISIVAIIVAVIMAVTPVFAEIDPAKLQPISDGTTQQAENAMGSFAGKIMAIIRNIGIIAAVIILMILGLQYLTGSLEQKADYKKSLMPYIVGIVVLFGASAIAQFIISFAKL